MNKKLMKSVAKQIGGMSSLKEFANDVCNHGASSGFSGFMYYAETEAFTKNNYTLIMELLSDFADDLGINVLQLLSEFNCFKNMSDIEIFDGLMNPNSDDRTTVYNGLAWFALEEAARSFENN